MVRIVPIPAHTAFVVVRKDPLQAFYVGLPDLCCEFLILSLGLNQKFAAIIAHFPALNSKLYCVNVALHHAAALNLCYALCLFDHHFLNNFIFFLVADVSSVKFTIEVFAIFFLKLDFVDRLRVSVVIVITHFLSGTLPLLPFNLDLVQFEEFLFKFTYVLKENIKVSEVNFAFFCKVAI